MSRFLLLISFFLMSVTFINAQQEAETDTSNMTPTDTISTNSTDTSAVDSTNALEPTSTNTTDVKDEEKPNFHQVLKSKFIEGGAGFMGIVLITLILGLALCIERILYLASAGATDHKGLLEKIQNALQSKSGGIDTAKEICRNTRGPIAGIFYQGLQRMDKGVDAVEKTIMSYGSVEMGRLERGTTWISLFIALAPMLGFMGTVIGMIGAFDAIEAAGDISPSLVAGGIKVALLTTVFGLIVAIILQIFYNYIMSAIDNIVNKMEDASIDFVDMIADYK